MTLEQKKKMYNALTKEELIDLLIEKESEPKIVVNPIYNEPVKYYPVTPNIIPYYPYFPNHLPFFEPTIIY